MSKSSMKNLYKLIQAATNEIPIEQQFLNDLKFCIEKENEKGDQPVSKTYKPSSMHCIRNMYYQRTGQKVDKRKTDSLGIGIVEIGSYRHEALQNYILAMKKQGIDCEYIDIEKFIKQRNLNHLKIYGKDGIEYKVHNEDLNMNFRIDGIIKYKKQYHILEIKTETSNKHWSRNEIADDHVVQGIAYCLSFKIDSVLFLYESRDNCGKKSFILKVTNEMKEQVISKIEECENYVRNLILPPKPKDLNKSSCQYCGYFSLCRKEG